MQGRPLRFLGMVVLGWVAWRGVTLWPTPVAPVLPLLPELIERTAMIPRAEAAPAMPVPGRAATNDPGFMPVAGTHRRELPHDRHIATPARAQFALAGLVGFGGKFVADDVGTAKAGSVTGVSMPTIQAQRFVDPVGRWSASAWLLTRAGGGTPGTTQLGGGQAGFVVRRGFGTGQRIAGYARATSPLDGPGREAAIGVEWQPTALPIRTIAERRIAIDGGTGGTAIGAVGGIGPTPFAGAGTVEAYGQAGMIWRDRSEGYGDGFVRITYPVAMVNRARIDLGIGAWGAAQRDAHRADIGPSIGATLAVAGRTMRASVDWRQRIAGDARPDSGPALTLAADF